MRLAEKTLDEVGAVFHAAFTGESPAFDADVDAHLSARKDPIYLALRAGGRRKLERWFECPDGQAKGLIAAAKASAEGLGDGAEAIDQAEINLTHAFADVDLSDEPTRRRLTANVHRGIVGLELRHEDHLVRVAPTKTIATNREVGKTLEKFRSDRRLTLADLRGPKVQTRSFEAGQIIVGFPGSRDTEGETLEEPTAFPLYRGNVLVPIEEMNRQFVEGLERDLGNFLVRAVQSDGKMTYMYYPSRGEESQNRNNMIRQWMATLALCRLSKARDDKKIADVAESNIRYNLRKYYHASGKYGLIEWAKKVKLGAVSLAVLSLYEHPKRKQFKRVESKLWNTIDYLNQEDGEFRTFFKPADRNDVQNFYPGEAQLAWAFKWDEKPDDALLERFMRTFRYYRDWHFQPKNRNPAFIPWHAQAYYLVWKKTKDEELRDFVFAINDWLMGLQQWGGALYEDTRGRFHDPNRRYGPPHASSTGVYMEGLIDAFCMARELGDEERKERYRLSILRGLRSTKQLMFRSDIDMFYVGKREWLHGGMRTTVYDNTMRIDNVQHCLMAILKILDAFEDEDFSHPEVDYAELTAAPRSTYIGE